MRRTWPVRRTWPAQRASAGARLHRVSFRTHIRAATLVSSSSEANLHRRVFVVTCITDSYAGRSSVPKALPLVSLPWLTQNSGDGAKP